MLQQPIIEEIAEYLFPVSETIVYGLRIARLNKVVHGYCTAIIKATRTCAETQPPTSTGTFGGQIWNNKRDQAHRDWDLPAIISTCGNRHWFRYGIQHRSGKKPAIIWSDGDIWFFENGHQIYLDDKECGISTNGNVTSNSIIS